jgi:protein-S-isoprenylcysteine O-methyltransferase Ste14
MPPPDVGRVRGIAPTSAARAYLAVQAVAGTVWWVAVYASDDVRRWTLGGWPPGLLVGPDLVLFVGGSAVVAARGGRGTAAVTAAWTALVAAALAGYGLVERQAGWGAALMALATAGTVPAAVTLWCGWLPVERFFVGPFAFRVAGERSGAGHVRRSLGQLVVFWTVFLVLLPLALAWGERRLRLTWPPLHGPGWATVGAVVFVAGSALGVWSCLSMARRGEGTPLPAATARNLVVGGPYAWVRNPMAVAGALQTIGAGLWLGSWWVVGSSVAGALLWNTWIRPAEEADLGARFGPDYEAYREDVRCWVPSRP